MKTTMSKLKNAVNGISEILAIAEGIGTKLELKAADSFQNKREK